MHQAALIGEYAQDATDYGWAQLEQGLSKVIYSRIPSLLLFFQLVNIIGRK